MSEPIPDAALASEVDDWLPHHWDPDATVVDWWRLVADAGWTAPHFPTEWGGRGLSRRPQSVVRAQFHRAGALAPPGGLGLLMAAPTIHTHGTPEQVDRYVAPILRGEVAWCQLFSEPGAGSDRRYSEALVFSTASSIYGGTGQIQRNIIGERALGLPREPKIEETTR